MEFLLKFTLHHIHDIHVWCGVIWKPENIDSLCAHVLVIVSTIFNETLYELQNRICRQIQDPYVSLGINEIRKQRGCSPSWTCSLLLSQEVVIKLISVLCAAVSEIHADFQICHIWEWNLTIGKNPTPGSQSWAYFCSMGSGFWDIGRFSKLPRLGMAKVPEIAQTVSFHPRGSKLRFALCMLWAVVSEILADLQKPAIFGHETDSRSN